MVFYLLPDSLSKDFLHPLLKLHDDEISVQNIKVAKPLGKNFL